MAAVAQVVCPFFGVVFERLKSLIHKDHIKKLGPLVKELKKLYKTFCKIKEVLNDAEERQFKEEADGIRLWLRELNDAAYEADDVLDDFEYEEGLQQLASEEATSSSNNVSELHEKIQTLNKNFHELAEEISGLELRKEKEKSVVVSPERITISLSTEPKVYGRDEDREKLVNYLTSDQFRTQGSNYCAKHPTASRGPVLNEASSSSSKDPISVFPILGMGGLGKTTLAQLVYNDERVENHFKHRSWICVSDVFDIKRLMKAIVASISGSECNLEDLEPLQQRLREEVHGKRFLLVLDDVWEESQEEWNKIMRFFEGGAQGSSIIVTTRLPTVASITSKLPSHCLNGLSSEDCWALFKQYAFGPGNEESEELVKIGKAIVEKCKGLPLAAKAMGGLLRLKNEVNEWNEVKDSAIWELPQSSMKGILPALRLSYYHLSSMLKQCFVYCSIFPKDFVIEKERLIKLWMANGLVQSRAKIELEDVGNEIFTALLQRSFFQNVKHHGYGGITCTMHDLVHDLASHIAGDEYFVEDVGSARNITERTRHLSLWSYEEVPDRSLPCLRSLIRLREMCSVTPKFVFSDFILLRALDLKSSSIEVVPDCIGEMTHLRYLDLSFNGFTSLPMSICRLRNMQTLRLSYCSKLESLPGNFGNMSNLRHLDVEGCERLRGMPIGIGQLACLQTLSHFMVGKGSRRGIGGLQLLNNLRENLVILGLWFAKTSREAKDANLMSKKNVHTLKLFWSNYPEPEYGWLKLNRRGRRRQRKVLEGLQPHVNVRTLFVGEYRGVTSPSWLTPMLVPNLVEIYLNNCTWQHLGSLRRLPSLKVLKLFEIDSLKFIEEKEVVDDASAGGGFPSLEELILWRMPDLEGWSSSSSSQAAAAASAEEGVRLEEPMHNLEGSTSQAAAVAPFPCLKSQSAKKLERCPKLKTGGGGLPLSLSSSSLSQAAATTQVAAVFPCLKSVTIKRCPKLRGGIPLAWSPVQNVDIDGIGCNGMVLASLQDLPSLPSLQIAWFGEMEYFPSGTLTNLTALHDLKISHCYNLKALPVELYSLATLTELQISECPKLEYFPSGTLTNLTALHKLEIRYCDNLKALPVELYSLATLTELQISKCPKLVSLAGEREGGLKSIPSLKTLFIDRCAALERLPELNKASLVILRITGCPEMEFSKDDFEQLVVLKELRLTGLPKLTCFPEGIKHSAATLRYLEFHPCSEYGAVVDLPDWIGTTLTSLEYLEIDALENWKVLPQWMQHLTALKDLVIWGCNEELAERWENRDRQREENNSFNMIAHVPHITLSRH